MNAVASLYGKEVRGIFLQPIAWVVLAVFLLVLGYTFASNLALTRVASLSRVLFQAADATLAALDKQRELDEVRKAIEEPVNSIVDAVKAAPDAFDLIMFGAEAADSNNSQVGIRGQVGNTFGMARVEDSGGKTTWWFSNFETMWGLQFAIGGK